MQCVTGVSRASRNGVRSKEKTRAHAISVKISEKKPPHKHYQCLILHLARHTHRSTKPHHNTHYCSSLGNLSSLPSCQLVQLTHRVAYIVKTQSVSNLYQTPPLQPPNKPTFSLIYLRQYRHLTVRLIIGSFEKN